jgi:hypothetical protein
MELPMARKVKTDEIETPPESGQVRMVVLRDFWPTENEADRVRANSVIDVTAEEAMDGLESGNMARFKP